MLSRPTHNGETPGLPQGFRSVLRVGRKGFEPLTPCASCRCASQLRQRPVRLQTIADRVPRADNSDPPAASNEPAKISGVPTSNVVSTPSAPREMSHSW